MSDCERCQQIHDDGYPDDQCMGCYEKEHDRLIAENARLRAALEWYADPMAYVADELENDSSLTAAWYDKGKIARKALGHE
jgi:hypothetical protein